MSEYLRTHPNIHMSPHKEPMYFSTDITPCPYGRLSDYLSLFDTHDENKLIFAEASTTYLYSRIAPKRIHDFAPESKIMVMLRNPIDMVYALHGTLLRIGSETEPDFETAWHLQESRRRGKNIPFAARQRTALLQYHAVGCLGSQMKALLDTFPKRQVHVTIFDDFALDPKAEYRRLLDFLGLPDDGRKDFPRINESTQFKSMKIAVKLRDLRARTFPIGEEIKRLTGIRRLGIMNFVDRFNLKVQERPKLRPEFRDFLNEVFYDEVELLEALIGRDLSAWKKRAAPCVHR